MKAYQIVLPTADGKGRTVLFREHTAGDMEQIYGVAGISGDEAGPLMMHKMAVAGLQIAIFEIDGVARTFEMNRAQWATLFTLRECIIITKEWSKVYYGEQGNVAAVPVVIAG
jgi:hypothetical protein